MTVGFVAACLLVMSGVASAGECFADECDRNTTISISGGVAPSVEIVSVTGRERSTAGGSASGWVTSCSGEVVSGVDALHWLSNRAVPFGPKDVATGFDPGGSWGVVRCPAHPNVGVAGDVYAIYEVSSPPQRVVDLVVARAYEATVLPTLSIGSSPSGRAEQPLVTGLESWLWLEGWQSASASASLPGSSATVTAAPDENVRWTLRARGHAIETLCHGPGRADDDGCSILPAVRGSGSIEVRVRWTYSVTCVPGCTVTLPDRVTEAAQPVEVAEVRGVITR